MSSSVHHPESLPKQPAARRLWSLRLGAAPRGLCLAREVGWVLAWDADNSLYLVSRAGEPQGRTRLAGRVQAACCSDDGSACAAVGGHGEVWWLAPDLMPRWERRLSARALACALDPFGNYLAVADAGGGLHLLDRQGKLVSQAQTPRPLAHLAFVPEEPVLLGCADFGLVAGFDRALRCLWHFGLVANVAGLAVNGDGSRLVLACYSDGLRCFSHDGRNQTHLAVADPCRLVGLSYDGRRAAIGGSKPHFFLLDVQRQTWLTYPLDSAPVALSLAALAETAFAALADETVLAIELS